MTSRALVEADAACAATLIRLAFAAQSTRTDPPSGAFAETTASIAAKITAGGGACIEEQCTMRAVVLWSPVPDALYVGRLAVHPDHRRRGLARALIALAEQEAHRRALPRLTIGVRMALPDNLALFTAAGFVETGRSAHPGYAEPTSIDMEKRLTRP